MQRFAAGVQAVVEFGQPFGRVDEAAGAAFDDSRVDVAFDGPDGDAGDVVAHYL